MSNVIVNPFTVREKFAKDFVESIRATFMQNYILHGTARMCNLDTEIHLDGKVVYHYDTVIHHPSGYHDISCGIGGACAAFDGYDEVVRVAKAWDVLQNVAWNKRSVKGASQASKDFAALWNAVFEVPKHFTTEYSLYDYVLQVVEPAFKKIIKYW